MTTEEELSEGDVVQIDPEHDPVFAHCFMLVDSVKPWGAQGYVEMPGQDGIAPYRCPHSGMTRIGEAAFERDLPL